jgi:hypothetical protein
VGAGANSSVGTSAGASERAGSPAPGAPASGVAVGSAPGPDGLLQGSAAIGAISGGGAAGGSSRREQELYRPPPPGAKGGRPPRGGPPGIPAGSADGADQTGAAPDADGVQCYLLTSVVISTVLQYSADK